MNEASPPSGPAAEGYDLLRVRGLRALILWRGFPVVFQAFLLVAFVALAVLSWNVHPPADVNGKLFAKANLTTLLIWGLWWPAMVWVAVLLGRVWCAVCPLELASNLGERLAQHLSLPRLPLARWMASGAIIAGIYVSLQMLVPGIHLHRVPAYTSFFLLGLLALAVVTGLHWRDRAFCRGFCPVGLLLGTYGRGGMVAVRPAPGRSDAQPARDARETCPSLLNPRQLASNARCLVCCYCVKCSAPGAMRVLLRRPFAATDTREPAASWPVTIFVMVVSGFVISELFSEWPAAQKIFLAAPAWLTGQWHAPKAGGWLEGIWTLGVVPLTLWLMLAAALRLGGTTGTLSDMWRRLALPVAVIVSVGHMSKGLAKFVSWAPFLPGALRDPAGAATAEGITRKTILAPAPWLERSTVSWIALALLLAGLLVALREDRLARRETSTATTAVWPLLLLSIGFAAIITGWR